MIQVTEEMIEAAKDTIAKGTPEAVGYRIMTYPIDVSTGLAGAEIEKFENLYKKGFLKSTEAQADRESAGSHYGILVSLGCHAYKGDDLGAKAWVQEGDVLIMDRYNGVKIEIPVGSGQEFRFSNDEAVVGRMRKES